MIIEKFLNKMADTQKLIPQDQLTEVVERYSADELYEDSLDMVFAASKPDFSRFWSLLNNNRND